MATSKKVSVMSEDRVENGENGLTQFVLSAVNSDFDITVTVDSDAIDGCDVGSIFRLAQRSYSHVLSNEAASAGINRDQDKYPDLDAFLKQWRTNKRAQIVSGEYTTRQVGPRISAEDKEWRRLIIEELLKPRVMASGIAVFPTSGKAKIQDKTVDEWVDYCKASPKYAELKTRAYASVLAAKEKAAAVSNKADAFADL